MGNHGIKTTMKVKTKQDLIDYCLRKLGSPVININVAYEQIEDRIDDAIEAFSEKHYDATEELWLFHTITADEVSNGYIKVDDNILTVIDVLPYSHISGSGGGEFGVQRQIMRNGLYAWSSFDQIDYFMKMTSLSSLNDLLNADIRFEHIVHRKELKIHNSSLMFEDSTIVLRAYKIVDPEFVWNNYFIKKYSTALIKLQWGENISKFENVQLLGGVTINGERLVSEAKVELEKLEKELETTYMFPTDFIVG